MDIIRYKMGSVPENDFVNATGSKYEALAKDYDYNWWIESFLYSNPHKTIKDVFGYPKFRAQKKHYTAVILELQNGLQIMQLFYGKKGVFRSIGMSAEAVEDALSVLEDRRGGARDNSGRKQKSDAGKAVTVSFSCSPEQKEALQSLVSESGLSQSEFILSKVLAE